MVDMDITVVQKYLTTIKIINFIIPLTVMQILSISRRTRKAEDTQKILAQRHYQGRRMRMAMGHGPVAKFSASRASMETCQVGARAGLIKEAQTAPLVRLNLMRCLERGRCA